VSRPRLEDTERQRTSGHRSLFDLISASRAARNWSGALTRACVRAAKVAWAALMSAAVGVRSSSGKFANGR
jgi:hypothetical protein